MSFVTRFLNRFTSIERDRQGNTTYMISSNQTENNKHYLTWALDNPVLFTAIALKSKALSNVKFKHLNANGDIIENSEVVKLLKSPNYFQTQQNFIFQLSFFMSATGTNYIYAPNTNRRLFLPSQIYNLIPTEINYNNIQKINKFFKTKDEFVKFESQKIKYKLNSTNIEIEVKNLIPFYDIANGLVPDAFFSSPSKVRPLERNLLNIDELLKSKNINAQMSQKFLATSGDNFNGVSTPITTDDRNNIQKILLNKSIHITDKNVNVNHLVSNLKNLTIDPQIQAEAQQVLLAYGLNSDVLNYFSGGSSTYENQERGEIRFYQNEIQPIADDIADSFSQHFGLFEKSEKLIATFEHLPIMQKVLVDKMESFEIQQKSIKTALDNGTINIAKAIQMTEEFLINIGL